MRWSCSILIRNSIRLPSILSLPSTAAAACPQIPSSSSLLRLPSSSSCSSFSSLSSSLCFSNHPLIRLFSTSSSSSMSSPSSPPFSPLIGVDDQERYMNEEYCIVVDENDNVIGQGSKKDCHEKKNIEIIPSSLSSSSPSSPSPSSLSSTPSSSVDLLNNQSILHRAFSVFLFNENNELLLQQRAKSKPTFPSHYTNTCCSHPLTVILAGNGSTDGTECDWSEQEKLNANGVKRAAIRKLEHELGIKAGEIKMEEFHFLTRIYYWAADHDNHRWAEHEIDYILFVKKNQSEITLDPNPSEVDDIKWVSMNDLRQWMYPSSSSSLSLLSSFPSNTLWTPWFYLMCEKFLYSNWWPQLDCIIKDDGWGTDDHERISQKKQIYRLTSTPGPIAASVPEQFSIPDRFRPPISEMKTAVTP